MRTLMVAPFQPAGCPAMSTTTVFAVIGCHRQSPEDLLLQGDDGLRYAWSSPSSDPAPIADDDLERDWVFDQQDDEDPWSVSPGH